MSHSEFWTPERIERLKELWAAELLSTRQIANEIGVSKSAIMGKAHRLGLYRSPEFTAAANREGAQRGGIATAAKYAAAARVATPKPIKQRYPPKPEPPLPSESPPPKKWRVPFNAANGSQCHFPLWPLEQRTGLVCGAPTQGRPFCAYHHKVCWLRPRGH